MHQNGLIPGSGTAILAVGSITYLQVRSYDSSDKQYAYCLISCFLLKAAQQKAL